MQESFSDSPIMRRQWSWTVVVFGLMLVKVLLVMADDAEVTDDGEDKSLPLEDLMNGGVWKFTCDEYCAYCGCVGKFLDVENKCVCSCEPDAADFDCLEDVKHTKEFLGLNYTLEIRETGEGIDQLDATVSKHRVQRQVDSRPRGRRRPPHGRRRSRTGQVEPRVLPTPLRPHRRTRERRPNRRRDQVEPVNPSV